MRYEMGYGYALFFLLTFGQINRRLPIGASHLKLYRKIGPSKQ